MSTMKGPLRGRGVDGRRDFDPSLFPFSPGYCHLRRHIICRMTDMKPILFLLKQIECAV